MCLTHTKIIYTHRHTYIHALDIHLTLEQRRDWHANSHKVANSHITLTPSKLYYNYPSISVGVVSRTPKDIKTSGCSSSPYKTVWANAYTVSPPHPQALNHGMKKVQVFL